MNLDKTKGFYGQKKTIDNSCRNIVFEEKLKTRGEKLDSIVFLRSENQEIGCDFL